MVLEVADSAAMARSEIDVVLTFEMTHPNSLIEPYLPRLACHPPTSPQHRKSVHAYFAKHSNKK